MTMQPQADTTHIGIAENQVVETPSSNPVDYTWILFKGPQGEKVYREKEVYKDLRERKVSPVKMVQTVNRENQLNQIGIHGYSNNQNYNQVNQTSLYLLREQQVLTVGLMVRDLLVDGGCQWV